MSTNKLSLIFALILISLGSNCFGAELLVRAKPHYLDSLAQIEVNKMSDDEKQSYNARSQIGDIIVVRPDGWKWGKEECLPNFIVIKIPDLKIEDAKKFEENLTRIDIIDGEETPILLKHRKYQIPKAIIDNAKQLSKTILEVKKAEKNTFIANIIQKTQ